MRKVLVLADSELTATIQAEVLRGAGFDVQWLTAIDGLGSLLTYFSPDVILTDVRMPGMSGSQLCRLLKRRPDTSHVPIVLCSSMPEPELARLAKDCGADAHLVKSGGPRMLAQTLTELCEGILW
jgi:CheY-like chemotaxis protein